MMLLCEECEMWRLLYSKKKLKAEDRCLSTKLDDPTFSCGASIQDLHLPPPLDEVFVRSVNCHEPIEKLYYSAGYEPICFYCATQVESPESTNFYPQCSHCISKPKVSRK